MDKPEFHLNTITGRINAKAFELLEQNPDGMRWTDLLNGIIASDKTFHPKTVNGCVWKLIQKYPEFIYKNDDGLFCLVKTNLM